MSTISAIVALQEALEGLLGASIELEHRRQLARRVDGRIIGTGQSDFTRANMIYQLWVGDMPVQLIDVPGIEGDEKNYTHLVEAAVAKAHLVICVNGTNKKPEAKTAERIKRYLRRATKVVPLINARGHADAYEFEEDRNASSGYKEPQMALVQTTEVLRRALGEQAVLEGLCVQGLIAFSALAHDTVSGLTSIHPSRQADLVQEQKDLLQTFESPQRMLQFSQIHLLPQLLGQRASNFKTDIIEANKQQVVLLLTESAVAIAVMLGKQQAFIAEVTFHFEHCCKEIETITESFLSDASNRRQQLNIEFFQALTASADAAVSANFGDQTAITRSLERAQEAHYRTQNEGWASWSKRASGQMNADFRLSTKRLMEDVVRREVHLSFISREKQLEGGVATTQLEMDLSLKDWASTFMSIGSYALSGLSAGAPFPGAGNIIGAIVGTLVGILKAVADFFSGKAERIRSAQRQLHAQLDSLQLAHQIKLEEAQAALCDNVRSEVKQHLLRPLNDLLDTLNKPQAILAAQKALLANMKSQLENMPHGSIRAIQH